MSHTRLWLEPVPAPFSEDLYEKFLEVINTGSIKLLSFLTTADKKEWDFTNDTTQQINVSTPEGEKAAFLVHKNRVGVGIWCVSELYKISFSIYKKYSKLPNWDDEENLIILNNSTKCLLLVAADCYSAWNLRRKFIKSNQISHELNLLNLILTKYPKSPEAWSYRKWLLANFTEEVVGSDEKIEKEVLTCDSVAEKYARNYYAWTYRLLVYDRINNLELLNKQFDHLRTWMRKNVADHCAFHSRHFLLFKFIFLINENLFNSMKNFIFYFNQPIEIESDAKNIEISNKFQTNSATEEISLSDQEKILILNNIKKEFFLITNMIGFYPGHESIWSYRRILFATWLLLLKLFPKFLTLRVPEQENPDQEEDDDDVKPLDLFNALRQELKFVQSVVDDNQISRFEQQRNFACSYRVWILFAYRKIFPECKFDSDDFTLLNSGEWIQNWNTSFSVMDKYSFSPNLFNKLPKFL